MSTPRSSNMPLMRALCALLLFALAPGVRAGDTPETPAEAAFRRLQALAGTWSRTTSKGTVIELTYETISSGSVVAEHFKTSTGRATMSVYHRNGPDLMMTHYCAQGNQPRLVCVASTDSSAWRFEFLDATNLDDPDASHLVRNELRILDATRLQVIETYRTKGVDGSDTLTYRRSRR